MLGFKLILYLLVITLLPSGSLAAETKPVAEAAPKVVRAQAFELTDAAGKTRAWLGTLADGTTLLRLYDQDGRQKVIVDSKGEIMILDAEGKPRVTAGAMDDDYGIGLFDSKGKIRADVRVNQDDEPAVAIRDSESRFRATMMTVDDEPMLVLSEGADEGSNLVLQVHNSRPVLSLIDAQGKQRTSLALTEKGAGILKMTDAVGANCLELCAEDNQPSLTLDCPTSKLSAFLGFSGDTDLSLMLLNGEENAQTVLLLSKDRPVIGIAHKNGKPAARMSLSEDGVPYFRTLNQYGDVLLQIPESLGPP